MERLPWLIWSTRQVQASELCSSLPVLKLRRFMRIYGNWHRSGKVQMENTVRTIANKEAADRSAHHRVTRSAKNGDLLWSPLITDRLARTAVDTSIPGKTYSKAREMPPVFRLTTDHWLYRSVPPCRKTISSDR